MIKTIYYHILFVVCICGNPRVGGKFKKGDVAEFVEVAFYNSVHKVFYADISLNGLNSRKKVKNGRKLMMAQRIRTS